MAQGGLQLRETFIAGFEQHTQSSPGDRSALHHVSHHPGFELWILRMRLLDDLAELLSRPEITRRRNHRSNGDVGGKEH